MKKSSEIPFSYLFILFFLTIGTRTIIEKKFVIIDSMNLNGIKYILVDFLYFSLIGLSYVGIYYLLKLFKPRKHSGRESNGGPSIN